MFCADRTQESTTARRDRFPPPLRATIQHSDASQAFSRLHAASSPPSCLLVACFHACCLFFLAVIFAVRSASEYLSCARACMRMRGSAAKRAPPCVQRAAGHRHLSTRRGEPNRRATQWPVPPGMGRLKHGWAAAGCVGTVAAYDLIPPLELPPRVQPLHARCNLCGGFVVAQPLSLRLHKPARPVLHRA